MTGGKQWIQICQIPLSPTRSGNNTRVLKYRSDDSLAPRKRDSRNHDEIKLI